MIRRRTDDDDELLTLPSTVPTPERIRELTAEIRQHWSVRQRRRRAGLSRGLELMQMPLTPRRKGFWDDYLTS
jgi:hypothetical protein